MKKTIAALSMAGLMMLTGCNSAKPEVTAQPAATEVETVTCPAETPEMVVSAEFAVERLLAQREDALYYDNAPDSTTAEKVVLSFRETVKNVEFLEVAADVSEDGTWSSTSESAVYSLEQVTENDLLVIRMDFDGLMPTRAIRFTDASGNTQQFFLAMSGEDNVPLLIEMH